MYEYRAIVTKVYDGDTITVDWDLGRKVWIRDESIRLVDKDGRGVDAPEVRGGDRPEGLRSRDYLRHLVLGREVIIKTRKDSQEKYGRYLASVWLEDPHTGHRTDVVQLMLDRGLMVYQDY